MSFLLPAGLNAEAVRELERACVAGGPDNMPWPTRVQAERDRLEVHRDVDESGYLVIPWDIDGFGRLMGNTATLMERPEPYHLQAELARGKVNQVRCQCSDWQAGGLVVPASLEEQIHVASGLFGRAITEPQAAEIGKHAQDALVQSYRAADALTRLYIQQVFEVRHEREPRLASTLGCRLHNLPSAETAAALTGAMNGICVPLTWSVTEPTEGNYHWEDYDAVLDWAESQELAVTAGPLIDFSSSRMPDWLWLWERDTNSLAKFMSGYVTAALKRYRKRIRRWQLTSASNSATVLSMGEEELLWLTMKLTQAARQVDPGLELIVGVAQPWGEYMALEDRTHSPFIFADTLIRSELNLAALDLEVIMGVGPRGSYCRDLLETSRMLDMYALLGVPVRVTLGYPSAATADAKADPELRVAAGNWGGSFSPEGHASWTASFADLALSKPYVQAMHWVELSDADPHQFPHCGLFDSAGRPKPAVQPLRQLREKHLR